MIEVIEFYTTDDDISALAERSVEIALAQALPWLYLWAPGVAGRLREATA